MGQRTVTVIKSIAIITGAALAGPTGALIGNLSSSILQAILPGLPEFLHDFQTDLFSDLLRDQGRKLISQMNSKDQHLVNHDLQTAFRDALLFGIQDIGGKECFPSAWRKNPRKIPLDVLYTNSSEKDFWKSNSPYKTQVRDCLRCLAQEVEEGKILPIEPPLELPASDVRCYLESNTPEKLTDTFFNQNLAPFLSKYKSLIAELPDFLPHLKRHLLDRTLIYLGENLKERTPAWRAYNRMVMEQTRNQLVKLGREQENLSRNIENILSQLDEKSKDSLTDGLADLVSLFGSMEKKLDEQLSNISDRLATQHKEIIFSLQLLNTTSTRIETKVDRVLRILEDGRFLVEGIPPIAIDVLPEQGEPPFKGMQFFDEKDAGRFFGREKLISKIVGRLCSSNFLAVVGASGSGKSSLVRAGLLPALRKEEPLVNGTLPPDGCKNWQIHLITPGEHPLETLAVTLTRADESVRAAANMKDDMMKEPRSLTMAVRRLTRGKTSKHRILLVVDQFEELFTLSRDENERQAFLDNLITAISPEGSGSLMIVITLRADFYDECGRYTKLRMLLQDHQEYIGPMAQDELRRVIEEPARLGKWEFERSLVDLILRDVGEEPGALPLLSHALLETWNHRRGRLMTLESYAEAGGVRGAIAQTAETIFHKRLTANQQTIARGIFLRLTELGEGTQDTRRRVPLDDLVTKSSKHDEINRVLAALVDSRLLTTSEDMVEVAHEALIREWPLLRTWLSEDRETLHFIAGVRRAAREWILREKDVNLLIHRGGRLEEALKLIKDENNVFNSQEIDYINACKKLVEGEQYARDRLRNRLLIAAISAAMIMLILGLWGLNRAQEASTQASNTQSQASTAIAERDRAENLARIAHSRQLAAEANTLLADNPERSILLSVESFNYSVPRLPQSEQTLRNVLAAFGGIGLFGLDETITYLNFSPDGRWMIVVSMDHLARIFDMHSTSYESIILQENISFLEFSPDGHWLAIIGTGNIIQIWDLQNPILAPVEINGLETNINDIAFSPDGRWMVTGSMDNIARLWDMQDLSSGPMILRGHQDEITSITFSPDGNWFVTASMDQTARLWNLHDLTAESIVLLGHTGLISNIEFSPDGRWLVTASNGEETARLWDLQNPISESVELHGNESPISSLLFSQDGRWLVLSNLDRTAFLWDLQSSLFEPIELSGFETNINILAFSPDGRWLVASSAENYALMWDLQNPTTNSIKLDGHTSSIISLIISQDGHWLATGSLDNTILLWDLNDPMAECVELRGHEGPVVSLAFDPNGHWLATGSMDHTIRLWNIGNVTITPLVLHGFEGSIIFLLFSSDGRWLATINENHNPRIWDMQNLSSEPFVLLGHESSIYNMAFSQDGRWLATASFDGTARLWNVRDPSVEPVVLHGNEDLVTSIAFSPDGQWLLTGNDNLTAQLWNLENPAMDPLIIHGSNYAEVGMLNTEFSPDGRYLAFRTEPTGLFLWMIEPENSQTLVVDPYSEAFAFSPDSQWLASGSRNSEVILWDMQNLDYGQTMQGSEGVITTLEFSPDGHYLASGSIDHTIGLWDMQNLSSESMVLRGHEGGITALTFSADGRWLATGSSDFTVRLWDMQNLTSDPVILLGHEGEISSISFSPDGNWLATGSRDNTVRLWDLQNPGYESVVLRGHEAEITSLSFSPDSQILASASRDSTVRLWDMNLDRLIERACLSAGRNLSMEEWNHYFPDEVYRTTCSQYPAGT